MRHYFVLLLLIVQSTHVFGGHSNTPVWIPVSMHNTDELKEIVLDACSDLRAISHLKLPKNQSSKNHYCTTCDCHFTTASIVSDPSCTEKNHTKRLASYYIKLFFEGMLTGAKNYLILDYLYQIGVYKASTQIAINFVSNESIKLLLNEKAHDPEWKKIVRQLLAAITKRVAKISLMQWYPNIEHDVLFEPHKMNSLVAGTTIHAGSTLAKSLVIPESDQQLSLPQTDYFIIKLRKKSELMNIVIKFFSIALGVYVANQFLEEPLYDFAEFLTDQIRDFGPEVLKEVVSFTK